MGKKWYGDICNRLEENRNYTGRELREGDDITMYYWSDRTCYYITKVVDQKHIFVRQYEVVADRSKEGGMGHQNWLYFKTYKEEQEYLNKCVDEGLLLASCKQDINTIKEPEPEEWVFRYRHWNRVIKKDILGNPLPKPIYRKLEPISFGVRNYYYDWSFQFRRVV